MIKARRIGHATFETPDLDRQIDYYQEVIGLCLVGREADRAFLATDVGQLTIVLEKAPQERCTKLSFEVAPEPDFHHMARLLSEANIGCEKRSNALPGVPQTLTFTDSKGTAIELFSEWQFVATNKLAGGARPVKLGHIAFVVPDPKTTAEFYQQTMDFRVSDWIEDFFVFLRCGLEHHTVNFVRGPTARIHHFAFELRDSSHLLHACDLLGRRGTQILWGPVRHGPGHNIAVYHRNPDGHLVEFFIDLDDMVDEELGYFEPRPWHRDRPQKPKVWTGQPRDIWGLPPLPEFMRDTR